MKKLLARMETNRITINIIIVSLISNFDKVDKFVCFPKAIYEWKAFSLTNSLDFSAPFIRKIHRKIRTFFLLNEPKALMFSSRHEGINDGKVSKFTKRKFLFAKKTFTIIRKAFLPFSASTKKNRPNYCCEQVTKFIFRAFTSNPFAS